MTVRLIQSAFPTYRSAFLSELASRFPGELETYLGDSSFDVTIRTGALAVPVVRLENVFLLGRRLLWQRGAVVAGIRAKTAILELNPRILSVWATLIARRLLGRPTILWGHAWPRGGRSARTDPLRGLLRRHADVVITYTETQADELRSAMPGHPIMAAPNAVYRAVEMHSTRVVSPLAFICVGRLVTEKKPGLLVEAFARAAPRLGNMRLLLVGGGPEREELGARARELEIAERVDLLGPVTEVARLRSLYAHALASVSPGYVGLSIIQSLGFGVPMVVSDAELHSPEIEAAAPGKTARFFAADSISELEEVLVELYEQRGEWIARREEISTWCRERYSAERMADGFVEAVRIARTAANTSAGLDARRSRAGTSAND